MASPDGIVRFTNGYLALADGTAQQKDLYISSRTGKIISGQDAFYSRSASSAPFRTVDLKGNILSPGHIDIQINGAWGVDFSELDIDQGEAGEQAYVEGLQKVARRLVRYGTTSFVPTIITQNRELYARLLSLLAPRETAGGASILGYHAEGPFLHPTRKGAHSSTLLLTADTLSPMKTFESVYGSPGLDQPGVKIITLAPDVPGVMECIPALVERGVTVSVGHTDATLEQAEEAFEKGARMITHLFNAMPPIHHRDPGLVGLLGHPTLRPYYGIIVDGWHSHPNTVRIAWGACREGCVLVSDAQSIMDPEAPDGVIDWRPGLRFRKEGLKVLVDGTNTLAGSAAPLAPLIKNLSTFASIPLPLALLSATLHPATCLGGRVERTKGRLEEGWDADLCVMNWEGEVVGTWVGGKEVWGEGGWRDGGDDDGALRE
ncbi:N-acetylglucosamine-6-phosphate deacetylase [Cryptococcus wingfieldii CBS 7118]|uniref:N-acetylglucosamine-6-phosphate deacetylase n=1 Tax=Cryptococcus wingfieldii CBS 7118 TaxID=1295528 RepID=A0A1E3IP39_9TREE|nr:N-acetylglucosamine-6-phosphate deacetylase [Cryptococcus wingfieldii CBS 7118]ODN90195.1 N-acetylglucosamine-6-phosphate deacetylase [Cryptococcus wingfieldii CBS 7118]